MRQVAAGVGGLLAFLFVLAQIIFWSGTSLGVVREHCLDLEASSRASADVDSKWTYILCPPLTFANLDPDGTCVRNSPLREGLEVIGIWDLPSPEEQVREHLQEQLDEQAPR